MPVWMAGPIFTLPTSRTKTGAPRVARSTMFSMSEMERINPTPRTTIDCCRLSTSAPPAFWLLALMALERSAMVTLNFSSAAGLTST